MSDEKCAAPFLFMLLFLGALSSARWLGWRWKWLLSGETAQARLRLCISSLKWQEQAQYLINSFSLHPLALNLLLIQLPT
jgi:hypothetical protein